MLLALGGTCHSPVAALTTHEEGALTLRAMLLSDDGSQCVESAATFAAGDTQAPARLARDLLGRAGPKIRALFGGTA